MSVSRTTSAGLWRFAQDYAAAGGVVANAAKGRFSEPAYFLYGRAIELALKAFLVARGVSVSELRSQKYGHDLIALLKRARRHRLGEYVKLSASDMRGLALLNERYRSKRFEYIETGSFQVPRLFNVQLFTHMMVADLKRYCIHATYPGVVV